MGSMRTGHSLGRVRFGVNVKLSPELKKDLKDPANFLSADRQKQERHAVALFLADMRKILPDYPRMVLARNVDTSMRYTPLSDPYEIDFLKAAKAVCLWFYEGLEELVSQPKAPVLKTLEHPDDRYIVSLRARNYWHYILNPLIKEISIPMILYERMPLENPFVGCDRLWKNKPENARKIEEHLDDVFRQNPCFNDDELSHRKFTDTFPSLQDYLPQIQEPFLEEEKTASSERA